MADSFNDTLFHQLNTEFSKLDTEPIRTHHSGKSQTAEIIELDPDVTLDGSENLLPPPYHSSTGRNPHSDHPSMNMMLYEKMLNLECLVANIHDTVVDSAIVNKDVSQQLKEINETMNKFQKEASVRLRQKLGGKPDCQTLFNPDGSQPPTTPTIETQDCFPAEDSNRYDRVCSMVETLISDANTVLSSCGAPSKEHFQEQLENDLAELGPLMKSSNAPSIKSVEMSAQSSENTIYAEPELIEAPQTNNDSLVFEFSCSFKRPGNSSTLRSLKKKLTLPLYRKSSLTPTNTLLVTDSSSNQSTETALIDPSLISFANFGTVGLLVLLAYWTFLFTLGTVLLDSSLCDMAGLQVMELVDAISGSRAKRLEQRRLGSKKSYPRIEYQIPAAPVRHRRNSF